ncbi:targeting protein for Xklp2-like isoform X1 [Octopus sinensis]|uniref:Targeting protein for Xklp2-like isoform X1 n=1 Tax=Octopus sinensis TaxID=2607531 RepID=A0A6P7SGY7_9MOLL|nr:targeting protein for Xklp2-like isoform X1 [Octopus sinensis]
MEPKWEFECPQFVDFTQNVSEDEDSDSWFDVDHEADINDISLFMPEGQNAIIAQAMPVVVAKPTKKEPPENVTNADGKANTGVSSKDQSNNKQSPLKNRSNICSSVEEFNRKFKNKPVASVVGKENQANKGPRRVLRNPQPDSEQPTVGIFKSSKKESEPQPNKSDQPEGNNHQRSLSKDANSKIDPVCSTNKKTNQSMSKLRESKSGSTEKLNKSNLRRSISSSSINKVAPKDKFQFRRSGSLDKLAVKNTAPKLKENLLRTSKPMTYEEIERQQMEIARNKALEAKKMAAESLKRVKNSKGYQPITSNKKLTVAKEFQFSSDKRLRSHSVDNVKSPITELSQILRKEDKSCPASKMPTRTVVQPFKFSEMNHKTTATNIKFQSVAEQINNFSRKTPDRYRSHTKEPAPKKAWCAPRCTIAKSPQLSSKDRLRPVRVLSKKELEEKELEEIKMNQFKAKDVNRKILEAPVGVKEVPKKEPTVVKPFDLPGSKIPSTKRACTDDEIDYRFRAQPVPTEILRGVVGVKEAESLPVTIPASPAFALKQRIHRPHIEEPKQENLIKKPKFRPYIHSGIRFEPKLDHRCTVIEPFTFDDRMREYLMKKEEHIKKIKEESEKVSEFYANPIPNYKPGLPAKKPLVLTKQEPFKLLIEERVEKRIEEKQRQLEEEARLFEENMKFKAQPCDIINKTPFVPQLDHKCTVEVAEFKLNTEVRQAQRQQYFEKKKAHEMEVQASQMEQEQLRKEEEEREIQRLRAEAVHKAKPIRHYKAVEIQRNLLPPTIPQTPKFCYKSRVRNVKADN